MMRTRRRGSRASPVPDAVPAESALETVDVPGNAPSAGVQSTEPAAASAAKRRERRAALGTRSPAKRRCGRCEGCLRDECGECASCLARGGSRKKRRPCSAKACTGQASGPTVARPSSPDDDPPEPDGALSSSSTALVLSRASALVPACASDSAAAPLLLASAVNQSTCALCSSADVERTGSGGEYTAANGTTEVYERYRCWACLYEWNGVPPNRPHERRPRSEYGSKVCSECGRAFRRAQTLKDHMRKKHPTEAQAASYFLCQKCHEPFRTRAYCRDHQRLCTKTGDVIVCGVCGLDFKVAHHWALHKAQTGHRGHTMRGSDGLSVAGGEDASADAVNLDAVNLGEGLRLAAVRRVRRGEPPPVLFAEVVCAHRVKEEEWGGGEAGADGGARDLRGRRREEEEGEGEGGEGEEPGGWRQDGRSEGWQQNGERSGWQQEHASGAGSTLGDEEQEEEEEWDESDDELYDATPDGPLRPPSAGGALYWLQPGAPEQNLERNQQLSVGSVQHPPGLVSEDAAPNGPLRPPSTGASLAYLLQPGAPEHPSQNQQILVGGLVHPPGLVSGDAAPDGPLRQPSAGAPLYWLQPGVEQHHPENQHPLMGGVLPPKGVVAGILPLGPSEAVQVSADELADEFF